MSANINLNSIYEWAENNNIINDMMDNYANSKRGFPKDKNKLLEIKCLNLSSFNLDDIHKEIFNLVQLEELILCDNNIESIPSEIGNLQKLKLLDISKNMLTSLPKEICNLTQLERLEITDNDIHKINHCNLGKLTQLKIFYLDPIVNISMIQTKILYNLEDTNRR